MADKVDESTPAGVTSSPQAIASVPVVESADESLMTPPNPTMAALFDIVRALSSSSVTAPPVPVATLSGYVSFPRVLRRASSVATNDPADVIGSPASSLDRLMKSVLQLEGWADCAHVFMVPSSIHCDHLFLIASADAKYVESVERYLFEEDIGYPGLGDRSFRDVVFRSGCVRPWKMSY